MGDRIRTILDLWREFNGEELPTLRKWGQREVAPADATKAELDLHMLIWGDVYVEGPPS